MGGIASDTIPMGLDVMQEGEAVAGKTAEGFRHLNSFLFHPLLIYFLENMDLPFNRAVGFFRPLSDFVVGFLINADRKRTH